MDLLAEGLVAVDWSRVIKMRKIEGYMNDFDVTLAAKRKEFMGLIHKMAQTAKEHWYPDGIFPQDYTSIMELIPNVPRPGAFKVSYCVYEYRPEVKLLKAAL